MTDVHSPEQRSFNMSQIRGRDTKPEMLVRRSLHAAGLRYRLHGKGLPGKPDVVFAGARAVVFVHGCFWHMHRCKYGKPAPVTNKDFWAEKRRGNAGRDVRNRAQLKADGWKVFEVWECQTRDAEELQAKLAPVIAFVQGSGKRLRVPAKAEEPEASVPFTKTGRPS
ncbi:MAG: mismatch endonuclease, patch repair protein [Bryobacterales bacterium]|jgi:DNA mismatch endonuclease (patch repair protein)|nr:mismatch endonuclease, patch repair protein [Bryobacterales bacterium]